MTIFHFPSYRVYWTADCRKSLPIIAELMLLKIFQKLTRYKHFIDNVTIPKNNKDMFIKFDRQFKH